MACSVILFCDELTFLSKTAQFTLKDDDIDWWVGEFAELDISNASEEQVQVLLRRLAGYNPKIIEGKMILNLNEVLNHWEE
ncbi:MAG: hypothetical protein IJ104_00730 [Methanobrevibacter sp.]|nr:hypothetical protein [Methanobrevibacter sp.]MBQ9024894.1 hypothetical protein [Methanobrevibacter sp.]